MQDSLFCTHCQMTLEEFLNTGYVGCANCYIAFRANLLQAIEKTQGKIMHCGKKPPWSVVQQHIFSKKFTLRNALTDAICKKDHIQADRLYVQIKDIDKLEKLYEEEEQLQHIVLEKEGQEKLQQMQNVYSEILPEYLPKESEIWKKKLHALKFEIQELEKSICG